MRHRRKRPVQDITETGGGPRAYPFDTLHLRKQSTSFSGVMAVTTITITEEAYRALSRAKQPHESFSQVVRRLAEHSIPLSTFAGA